MASTSETHFINLNNNPLKVNIPPTPLSGIKTKANTSLIPIIQTLRQVSLIYKYTYMAIKEEKACIKKRYFYKYCPP